MEQIIGLVITAIVFFAIGYFTGKKKNTPKGSKGSHGGSEDESKFEEKR